MQQVDLGELELAYTESIASGDVRLRASCALAIASQVVTEVRLNWCARDSTAVTLQAARTDKGARLAAYWCHCGLGLAARELAVGSLLSEKRKLKGRRR